MLKHRRMRGRGVEEAKAKILSAAKSPAGKALIDALGEYITSKSSVAGAGFRTARGLLGVGRKRKHGRRC